MFCNFNDSFIDILMFRTEPVTMLLHTVVILDTLLASRSELELITTPRILYLNVQKTAECQYSAIFLNGSLLLCEAKLLYSAITKHAVTTFPQCQQSRLHTLCCRTLMVVIFYCRVARVSITCGDHVIILENQSLWFSLSACQQRTHFVERYSNKWKLSPTITCFLSSIVSVCRTLFI